jgi:hypothetical protein
MTKGIQEADQIVTSKHAQEEVTPMEDETYRYEDSGIRERHGYVPIWLQLVQVLVIEKKRRTSYETKV